MSRVRLSDATLDALAAGRRPVTIAAATDGRRATDEPDVSFSPMGLRPPLLECGQRIHGPHS